MDYLSSEEKRILTAYREFFGEDYTPSDHNTDLHVQAHKMCYLLKRFNCNIVSTGYVWNTYGPFSIYLQEILKDLDQNVELLKTFYKDNYDPELVLDPDILSGIQKLRNGLEIIDNQNDSRHWVELLASLSFLASTVLPASDFKTINSELKARKTSYMDDAENRKAWSLLKGLSIAY